MVSIPCNHPDIEEFINLKSDLSKATKANLSIQVTDEFMECVKNDTDYKLEFVCENGEVIERVVRAKDLFDKFCEMNWNYSEPAMLFWDKIEDWNLMSEDEEFEYVGVNPCSVCAWRESNLTK